MAASSNFSLRDLQDAEAANIAIAALLKTLIRDLDVDTDRVRQLVQSAAGDDVDLSDRAMRFVHWMAGFHDAEGERQGETE
jgi:hypothetical protein